MQQQAQPGQLLIDYAISREMTNRDGGKMYVQHVLKEKAGKLWEKLDNGAQIYFCGLKGMLPGILETLEKVAQERGVDWDSKLKELKANGQWHVEVY
jgi:ferredoxin--NADP+ reductase